MNDYTLKIAEDSGEIELELSSLESSNLVSRFGFSCLALIEKSESGGPTSPTTPTAKYAKKQMSTTNVTVHFTDDSPSQKFVFESDNIPMRRIYDQLLQEKIQNSNIFCPSR